MQQELVSNNYLRIPEFISRQKAAELANAFREHAFKNCGGDTQAPNSHADYNFLPFVRLLVDKIPEVTATFGEAVLPTYAYARVYKNGSLLKRHRDRAACEVSLTVNLAKSENWPIFFQRPDGSETFIELEPGDAVLYMGCVADHWREPFLGREYTQVFLHYVRSHGDNAWAHFDKNKGAELASFKNTEAVCINTLDDTEWKVNVL
jgi:hypothetical protein